MPKIDYSELNGLRLTVQSARLAILSKFTDFEKTVSAFSEETNLSGSSWESAKAYLTQLPAVSRGIFNVLSDFGEQLNAYLEAFQSEVGSPKNRLDSEHLSELNTRLQGIRQEKESILASIRQATQLVQYGPGSTMFGTSFGDMGVTALENSMEDLTKDIEILEKYLSFEAAHGSDFDEVNALLEQLKTGISGFNRTVTFDSSTGDFIAPTAKNQAWYQAVVQLNEERPEVRKEMVKAYREKKDANGRTLGYEVVYEMYIDGELNRAETEKMTEMMKKAGLGELGVFVLEVTGVNNFRRYFNGVDPITGEKLTSNEKSLAGLFGLMDAIGTVEAIKLLKNLNKGYALLDGVKVPDTIKTEKFVGSGSFDVNGKYRTKIDSKVIEVKKANLPDFIEATYTDGYYRTVETLEDVKVYRTYGGKANQGGAYATTSPASTRIDAKIDTALLPEWGNSRKYEIEITIPKGQQLNIGKVAPQTIESTGTVLSGGADQILLPQGWPPEWITGTTIVPSK